MPSSERLEIPVAAGPLDPAVSPAVPPKPAALPITPTEYHHFLRTPRSRWWKGVLAILSLVVGSVSSALAYGRRRSSSTLATGRTSWEATPAVGITVTPLIFLALNLSAGRC